MVTDFFLALGCSAGFSVGWKRARHIRHGHPYDNSVFIEKLQSANHPHNKDGWIYTVNIMACKECGLTWNDIGIEVRK